MPALFTDDSAARTPAVSCRLVEAKELSADGTSAVCEVLVADQVLSGVYEPVRRHLMIPCAPSTKLAHQPQDVSALVCSCDSSHKTNSYLVLLAAEGGATLVLPRDGAPNASEVRMRPRAADGEEPGVRDTVVALARGPDPYMALLEAAAALADTTGTQPEAMHAYVLPLLDGVNRLRYDAPLAAAKGVGKNTTISAALEQHLNEGVLVQAGPGCPAKSLLQEPGLRICQGMTAPLGLRYSGLSVVYGTATGHVLAVMDTAAALKMVPAGGMRPLAPTAGRVSGDADSPSAVSAGASAATSGAPSPRMSRSSSCDTETVDGIASLTISPAASTALVQAPPPQLTLSGRSITTAPVIQVLAAAVGGPTSVDGVTATGAPVQVLASFALLGVKTAGGRMSAVQCCRIMPASGAAVCEGATGAARAAGGLGLTVQVEVPCASACTLLMFVEGPDVEGAEDAEHDGVGAHGPVQSVLLQGRAAKWRYSSTASILSVELPRSTAVQREVKVLI